MAVKPISFFPSALTSVVVIVALTFVCGCRPTSEDSERGHASQPGSFVASLSAGEQRIIAEADATVTGFSPTDSTGLNAGRGETLKARYQKGSTGSGGSARLQKTYIRFRLPSLEETLSSAKINLFWQREGRKGVRFQIYGLKEASDYGKNKSAGVERLDEKWSETDITYNNAPGNLGDGTEPGLKEKHTTLLGSFSTPKNASTIVAVSGEKLLSFLKDDTNRLVTFIVIMASENGTAGKFSSRESSSGHRPELIVGTSSLDDEPTPEPDPDSDTFDLSAAADATITGYNPTDKSAVNEGESDVLLVRRRVKGSTGDGGSFRLQKTYMRFNLPDISKTYYKAILSFHWLRSGSRMKFRVYGLREKSSYGENSRTGEKRLGEGWKETALTYRNAPGNVVDPKNPGVNSTYLWHLGTITTPRTEGRISFDNSNLLKLLNGDKNRKITLVIVGENESPTLGTFASRNDSAARGPRLFLDTHPKGTEPTPDPEPDPDKDSFEISAAADATITGYNPTDMSSNNEGKSDVLQVRRRVKGSTGDGGSFRLQKIYIRFKLPSITKTVTKASLSLQWLRTGRRLKLRVYGLHEKSSYGENSRTGEDRLGEDWSETAITYQNAPGNVVDPKNPGVNSTYLRHLGTITTPSSAGRITFENSNLANLINNDKNKMLTLVIVGEEESSTVGKFASRNDSSTRGPSLAISTRSSSSDTGSKPAPVADIGDVKNLLDSLTAFDDWGDRYREKKFQNLIKEDDRRILVRIRDLTRQHKLGSDIGWNMCKRATGSSNCSISSSIGYGLCVEKTKSATSCQKDGSIGYGLCVMKTGSTSCASDGSIGYGLCVRNTGSRSGCSTKGTLGYGICTARSGSYSSCNTSGTVGYGICAYQRNTSSCESSGSLGYALCSHGTNSYSGCSSTGSIGYGMCAIARGSSSSCSTEGAVDYGHCVLNKNTTSGCGGFDNSTAAKEEISDELTALDSHNDYDLVGFQYDRDNLRDILPSSTAAWLERFRRLSYQQKLKSDVGWMLCFNKTKSSKCVRGGTIGYGICVEKTNSTTGCDSRGSLGYGMCVHATGSTGNCAANGTIGYGLCVQKTGEKSNCRADGTLGYGLCVAGTGRSTGCDRDGTVGYGICAAATGGVSNCHDRGSVAYGVCARYTGSTSSCSSSALIGYGICTAVKESRSGCKAGGTLDAGICVARKKSTTGCF